MENQSLVTVPLDALEGVQQLLDKARDPDIAQYVAGLANGMVSLIISNAKITKEDSNE